MTLPELSELLDTELVSDRSSIPISRRFHVQEGEDPELLWHYTGAEGLLGIVSEGQFRATDVFFFNDSSEVHYTLELIERALPEVRSVLDPGPATQVLDGIIEQIGALRRSPEFPYRMYAVCFCEEPDLLSQWRGYGALGGGFALGFSYQAMVDCISKTELGVSRIWYDPADQSQLIRETVVCACKTLLRVSAKVEQRRNIRDLARQAASYAFKILCIIAVSLKSPAFREEREWRVIDYASLERTASFLVRRGIVVPYVSLSLPLSALRRVQIGPTLEPKSAQRSVKEVLRSYRIDGVTVDCSAIPLRG
jgi:hypothetical protein